MAATALPQALDALAKATHELATSKVNVALAIGTAATALFTLFVALFTFLAARKAARSAQAAEQMVRIERERYWDEGQPHIQVLEAENSRFGPELDRYQVILNNQLGKGPAEDIVLSGVIRSAEKQWECVPQQNPPGRLGEGRHSAFRVDFLVSREATNSDERQDIFICHYSDRYGREYHSVHDSKGLPPVQTYRLDHAAPDLHRQVCTRCRPSETTR